MTQISVSRTPARSASDPDILIGARLRSLRKQRGLSQSAVADLLGITYQQVQKYESGRNRISAVMLFVIGEKLMAPVAYFYEDLASPGAEGATGILNNQHQIYATTAEGQKLIDAYRGCSEPVRRKMLSLMRTIASSGKDTDNDDSAVC